jgi:spore germination protein YaaH
MRHRVHPTLLRWFLTLVGLTFMAAGCLGSLLLLYGGGSWQSAAQMEATSLGTLEVSELIGTTSYQSSDQPERYSLLSALSQTLKLPIADPMGMLTSQLPLSLAAGPPETGTQANLFRSLSTWEQNTKKLALGWIPYDSPQRTIQMIQENPGITVISPKWLTVANDKGDLTVQTQPSVVDYAHSHNIKVWALFDNQFRAGLTHSVLSDKNKRGHLVQSLVNAARSGHLDGINVDFENVHSADQDNFTAFIRELSDALRPLQVTLSVDITPDVVFLQDDAAYFHAGLAKYCDYVILMAYDEHWAGDPTPGPVADVPWVAESVDDLLSTGVPANKLVLGLPFYARFWHVHSDGSVTSEAVAAANLDAVLAAHNAKSKWLDDLGVAYAKYDKPEGYMEVWYETDKTMERKLGLVNHFGLAGVAIWSLSLSDKQTWSSMIQVLRQSVS